MMKQRMAVVSVQLGTDRYTEVTKSMKATLGDRLGNLGMLKVTK